MTTDQTIVFAVLFGALLLFAWGRWRYDLVAVIALLAVVLAGIVPVDEAFTGFGHPAVVTVAAVLVISRALQNAGVVDVVMGLLQPMRGRPDLQMGAQTGLIAVLSALMNNVGALALLMPVALRNAYREGYAPAKSLMPLAFGSLLGGLVTLIGTPPNIIVSAMRQEAMGAPFRMFDFAPVGLAVAGVGVLFVVLVGWRLIPKERRDAPAGDKGFDIGDYLLEGRVTEDSRAVGRSIEELEAQHEDARVLGIARSEHRHLLPGAGETVRVDDVLILQGDPDALQQFITKAGLSLVETHTLSRADVRSDEIELSEVIITPGSTLTGKTPTLMRLRTIYRVNLLGVARHGRRPDVRLRDVRFQPGDVLLLQGAQQDLDAACAVLGCIPLAERAIGIGRPRRLALATGAFAVAIGMVIAGLLPVHLAFVLAVVALVLTGAVRLDELYASIDWPVLVLLGAMLPVGGALEATGGTVLVADGILSISAGLAPVWVLTLLLVSTMMLSDVINNNATAVLMAPIALTLATRLDVNPDAFLMAVAIGASCAFLTPIGHQSNTLVLAPGGYRFGDYWRMGLPLEVVITIVAVPLLLRVWPL
jgi:di/tricarboxylate transporter